jgi:hypothetical protein
MGLLDRRLTAQVWNLHPVRPVSFSIITLGPAFVRLTSLLIRGLFGTSEAANSVEITRLHEPRCAFLVYPPANRWEVLYGPEDMDATLLGMGSPYGF